MVELERVIEARFENRRRAAAIFGRAQDHDGVSRLRFVDEGFLLDLLRDTHHLQRHDHQDYY